MRPAACRFITTVRRARLLWRALALLLVGTLLCVAVLPVAPPSTDSPGAVPSSQPGGVPFVSAVVKAPASSLVLRWRLPSRESRAGRFLFVVGGDVLCMSPLYFFARLLSALSCP